MENIMRAFLLVTVLVLVTSGGAEAASQYICSITETAECSDGQGCGTHDFGGIVPPTFFHVDVERKVITLLAPDERRGEETPIDMIRETADGWILAGLESERAWTLYLTNTGHMTFSVTMDGTTWTAFGSSMLAKNAKP